LENVFRVSLAKEFRKERKKRSERKENNLSWRNT
jgi:hypothetical protein